jgi:hypothetical protein
VDWDGHPLRLVALLDDPDLTSYAQQRLANNQFFYQIALTYAPGTSGGVNLNLLSAANDHATGSAATGSRALMPMTEGAVRGDRRLHARAVGVALTLRRNIGPPVRE